MAAWCSAAADSAAAGGWAGKELAAGVVEEVDLGAGGWAAAAGHARAAEGAVLQRHVHLHGRVAPAVEDLAGGDVDDLGHGSRAPAMKRAREP